MPLLAGLGPLGVPELLIIAFIIVLIFGVGRLPEVGGAVGKGIKEFRKAATDESSSTTDQSAATAAAPAAESSAPAQGEAIATETRFCGECGARNARSAKFCAECGHSVQAAVQ